MIEVKFTTMSVSAPVLPMSMTSLKQLSGHFHLNKPWSRTIDEGKGLGSELNFNLYVKP